MPRAPRNPPPSSSIARLLDPQTAGRAIERAASPSPTIGSDRHGIESVSAPNPGPPHAPPTKREVLLSPDTDATLERLVQVLREATGARVTTSHAVRALLQAVEAALPSIIDALSSLGPLRLPGNGPRQDHHRKQFEAQLASRLAEGLRLAAPLQWEADEPLRIGSDPADGAAALRPSSSRPRA